MGRTTKKEINFTQKSLMALLQEIYNETVEQRNTAVRIQNKMLGFMKGPEDLTLLGPIIKEQQKILDSVLEKKLSLAKLQQVIIQKSTEGREDVGGSLSDDDKEMLKDLVNGLNGDTTDDNYKM
tara:strand:- start:34996 stop:35367 length:372 start_codon:yes stop_codon:yes gene_type:complete